ncbi:MAG: tetratricopeptide repeat protein [Terriglobia bacterium]
MTSQARVEYLRRSFDRSPEGMRRWAGWPILLLCALLAVAPLRAQAPPDDDTGLRDRALELSKQGNHAEALPLLEKVAAARPTDIAVLESLGDALMKEGRTEEAKAKFMDAIVAEPYQQASWDGLQQWAKATHATIEQPKIESPASVSAEVDGKANIKIDPKSLDKRNGDQVWIAYATTRALWRSEKFKKEFPDETTYRHTLAEEVDALQTVAKSVMAARNEKKHWKLDPALLTLVELHDQGLLEPYVLLARSDEGVAKDYPAYRDAHGDKLRLYLLNWVISTAEGKQRIDY